MLLTVANVAEQIIADYDTALHLITSGQLKAINVAKNPNGKKARWRVRESDLEAFLERRATGQPKPATTPRRAASKRAASVIEFY